MENEMRISPRRMLFSAVMASALVAGNPLSAWEVRSGRSRRTL